MGFLKYIKIIITTTACVASSSVGSAQANQLSLPPRADGAKTGTQFKDEILNLPRDLREIAIYREVVSGNVPDFIRTLKPVTLTATIGGQPHTGTVYVTPEYMAIGSEADYFRMPMTPLLAQWVADATSCSLPTRKMVDAIWTQAPCKLTPSPIPPSPEMITVPVFWTHQQTVQAQRNAKSNPLGDLVAGHKKDVVITPRLYDPATPGRVAIYGWHQSNGSPIQPLYVGHIETYADYSHGIRLISSEMILDSQVAIVQDVLTSSAVAALLSDEAIPFTAAAPPRYDAGPPPANFPYTDLFPASGRELGGWMNRFTVPVIQSFSPISPGGDGYVLTVKDPGGGIDTTSLGYPEDSDYYVQCDIYCDFRPELAANGFDRVGIFARDDGNGLFCGQNSAGTIKGNNYALTWDSNDGRVQCLRTVNGIPTDMLPAPQYLTGSQWRSFRIEAQASQITFKVDAVSLLSITDSTHVSGQFGIGYQEQFASNSNILGTRADNFMADVITLSAVRGWPAY